MSKKRDKLKKNYKGVLRKNNDKAPYEFNDLLDELKGKGLSRLTPYTGRHTEISNVSKKIIRKYVQAQVDIINETDEFL